MIVDTLQIRCLVNPGCLLGEGPVWDKDRNELYWVDILQGLIYRYNPADETLRQWTTSEWVGFVIITPQEDVLIAGLKSGLHHVRLLPDGTTIAHRIDRIDDGTDRVRVNDGFMDDQGRIWACTMDIRCREPLGSYYCYDPQLTRTTVVGGYVVANGPAISPDNQFLYTVETVGNPSLPKGIYISRIKSDGLLETPRLFIDWRDRPSLPDGLTTDANGRLWVGEYGGNYVRCYEPNGQLAGELPLPAWNVTKPAWGGHRGDILYVTSARADTNEAILADYPATGGILEISGIIDHC